MSHNCHEDHVRLESKLAQVEKERDELFSTNQALGKQNDFLANGIQEANQRIWNISTQRDKFRSLLDKCVKWMEPVMLGFGVKESDESFRDILKPSKEALALSDGKAGV